MNNTDNRTGPSRATDPLFISVGLMRADKGILLPLLALLSCTALSEVWLSPSDVSLVWATLVVERFLQLTTASFVAYRWRRRLEAQGGPRVTFTAIWMKILLIGFLLWGAIMSPLVAMSHTTDPLLSLVGALACVAALTVAIHYYFYSAVAGLLGGSLSRVLTRARLITRENPSSSLRAFIGPFALSVLAVGVFSCSYPSRTKGTA